MSLLVLKESSLGQYELQNLGYAPSEENFYHFLDSPAWWRRSPELPGWSPDSQLRNLWSGSLSDWGQFLIYKIGLVIHSWPQKVSCGLKYSNTDRVLITIKHSVNYTCFYSYLVIWILFIDAVLMCNIGLYIAKWLIHIYVYTYVWGFTGGSVVKNLPATQKTQIQFLVQNEQLTSSYIHTYVYNMHTYVIYV